MSRTETRDDTGDRTPSTDSLRARGVPWRDDAWRSPVDLLVLAAVVWSFGVVAGQQGYLAGGALVITWLLVPPVAVFAAGSIALVAVVPAGTPVEVLAVPASALAGLLLTTRTGGGRLRNGVVLVGAWLALGAVAWGSYALTGAIWLAGVALLLAGAAGSVTLDIMSLSRLRTSDE